MDCHLRSQFLFAELRNPTMKVSEMQDAGRLVLISLTKADAELEVFEGFGVARQCMCRRNPRDGAGVSTMRCQDEKSPG